MEDIKDKDERGITLSKETAEYLALYRDANKLFHDIYKTLMKYTPHQSEEEADERYTRYLEPASKEFLKGLLSLVSDRIEWNLLDGTGNKI